MKILAFGGNKLAGKDTCAIPFIRNGFKRLSFSDPLKALCIEGFGYRSELFHDQSLKEKPLDIPFEFTPKSISVINEFYNADYTTQLSQFIGTICKTPREMMQVVGTEMIRKAIDDQFWIKKLYTEIQKYDKVVIPDCRLKNERIFLKSLNAVLCLVKREGLKQDSHISENDLGADNEYDIIVHNDSTINKIQSELELWLSLTNR